MMTMTNSKITKGSSDAPVDYGFPSHLIPAEKKDKKWCLQYMKAFNREYTTGTGTILRWANEDYATWRQYANGQQPIDQYKTLLGVRKRKGKRDPSWLNIDWNILPVMPRIKAVVKNKILSQPYEIILKPIDQVSATDERTRRSEIVEYMANKPFLDEATKTLPIEAASPFEPGEPEPQNLREVDLYLTMFPKNRHAMEMLDQIALAHGVSDWPQIKEDVLDDQIEVGVGGTKVYIDNIGVIRIRRCVPERMITNACSKKDFSDVIRVGEYVDITISELRQRVPRGTFSEADYANMAAKVSGRAYAMDASSYKFFESNNRYPWDHERVTILDADWFSSDDTATIVKRDPITGKIDIIKKDNPYWLEKQGIKDQDYVDYHAKQGSERELIRDAVKNVYHACWVVGTEYIYDFGLQSNMIRALSSLNDCELGYSLYTLNWDSIMRHCMPVLDDVQKNWLTYQHHTNLAKPPGMAIDRRAISMVTIGSGKNAINLTAEDILKMYSETGSYIYNSTDQNGRPFSTNAITELKGGVSEQASKSFENVIKCIDLLHGIIGLNEFTDASSPDPRANKDIVQGAQENTNNALGTLVHAYTSIYRRTAQKICMLVPDAEGMGFNRSKIEALGEQTHDWFRTNADAALIDWSITVDLGITKEVRQRLALYIQQSLKTAMNPGGILPEDVMIIENESNLYRAYLLLSQKRKQREREEQQRQMAIVQQQSDTQTKGALMIEQAKQQTIMMQLQAAERQAMISAQATMAVEERKAFLQAMIIKMQKGEELKATEAELYSSLVETQMKNATQIKVAEIGAQAQRDKPKASSK